MKATDVNGVLSQIRAIQSQKPLLTESGAAGGAAKDSFSTLLKDAIGEVSATQKQASSTAASFSRGDPGTDIAEVMLSLNQAQVSFKALSEVRNRLVSAYKDVMNMPI